MMDQSEKVYGATFVNNTSAGQSFIYSTSAGWEDIHEYNASMRIKAYANDYTGAKTSISGKTVKLSKTSVNYNGKVQKKSKWI